MEVSGAPRVVRRTTRMHRGLRWPHLPSANMSTISGVSNEELQTDLAKVGIKINLQPMEWSTKLTRSRRAACRGERVRSISRSPSSRKRSGGAVLFELPAQLGPLRQHRDG